MRSFHLKLPLAVPEDRPQQPDSDLYPEVRAGAEKGNGAGFTLVSGQTIKGRGRRSGGGGALKAQNMLLHVFRLKILDRYVWPTARGVLDRGFGENKKVPLYNRKVQTSLQIIYCRGPPIFSYPVFRVCLNSSPPGPLSRPGEASCGRYQTVGTNQPGSQRIGSGPSWGRPALFNNKGPPFCPEAHAVLTLNRA